MAVSISFPSTTRNLDLPLLFSGQAQKEFSLNQAFTIVDAMLQRGVVSSLNTPPSPAEEGDCYRVLSGATGEWLGHEDSLAIRIGGAWHFVTPKAGMTIFDQTSEQMLLFNAGWVTATGPANPTGGATVDTEARAAISELVEALRIMGLFAG